MRMFCCLSLYPVARFMMSFACTRVSMARVHCSEDRIVITGRTNINVFSFEVKESALILTHQRRLNADVVVDEVRKLPEAPSEEIASTAETADKNGCGDSAAKNTDNAQVAVPVNKTNIRDIDKQILGGAFSNDGALFAVVTSMKTCLVYDTRGEWKERRRAFRLPKSPTAVAFDTHTSHVLVADRAGNVCRYKLDGADGTDVNVHRDIDGEDSCYEGESLLGHMSMVLDIVLSDDGRFLLSADRDEKLRISRYPQSFVIHRFCLGHTSYINSLCTARHLAFTSGGDGAIRVWNIDEGNVVAMLDRFASKAIRCIRKYNDTSSDPQDKVLLAVVLEGGESVTVISFDAQQSSFDVVCEVAAPSPVVDVAFCDRTHIVAITKESVVFGELKTGGHLRVVEGVDESVVADLRETRDGIANLEKKVGFDNIGEYQQRKNERINKRKRKAEETN